jgi:aspartate aminotransferase
MAVSRAVSRILLGFLEEIDYFTRREQPGVLDFTFGDPREMPPEAYVSTLRTALAPQREDWFAYKMYEPAAQEAAAASLGQLTGLSFAPDDILLTTGGFAARSVGMKAVADPGDEVIYSLPP